MTLLNPTPSSGALEKPSAPVSKPGRVSKPSEVVEPVVPQRERPSFSPEVEDVLRRIGFSNSGDTVFDFDPDFFKVITRNGNFTTEERARRTQPLGNSTVFRDVGLLFYKVKKGDTLYGIRNSLSNLPEFSYLKDQPRKIESFNIPPLELVANMLIPIPLENKERYLTDEQFAKYATRSISVLRRHDRYGKFIDEILKKATVQELLATMVAIAKQEAGGEPIGRYELHRWEPAHNVFSFSLFHVLMKGPGLDARRHLNKSEGQLYHPQNASDLVIAYLREKDDDSYKLFPIDEHAEDFARFYNGKGWRRVNPNYVRNILGFYSDAKEMIETLIERSTTPAPTPIPPRPPLPTRPQAPRITKPTLPRPGVKPQQPKRPETAPSLRWERIGRSNLTIAIRNAHYLYVISHHNETLLKTQQELHAAANAVSRYLVKKYRTDVYYPNEEVAMGKDKFGVFLKFRTIRDGTRVEVFVRP